MYIDAYCTHIYKCRHNFKCVVDIKKTLENADIKPRLLLKTRDRCCQMPTLKWFHLNAGL